MIDFLLAWESITLLRKIDVHSTIFNAMMILNFYRNVSFFSGYCHFCYCVVRYKCAFSFNEEFIFPLKMLVWVRFGYKMCNSRLKYINITWANVNVQRIQAFFFHFSGTLCANYITLCVRMKLKTQANNVDYIVWLWLYIHILKLEIHIPLQYRKSALSRFIQIYRWIHRKYEHIIYLYVVLFVYSV